MKIDEFKKLLVDEPRNIKGKNEIMSKTVVQRLNEKGVCSGKYLKSKIKSEQYEKIDIPSNSEIHNCVTGLATQYYSEYLLNGKVNPPFGLSLKDNDEHDIIKSCLILADETNRLRCIGAMLAPPTDFTNIEMAKKRVEIMAHNVQTFFLNNQLLLKDSESDFSLCCKVEDGYYRRIFGDCDFITQNGILDIKCVKTVNLSANIMQQMFYYLMSKYGYSKSKYVSESKSLGVYYPYLNRYCYVNLCDFSELDLLNIVANCMFNLNIKLEV